MAYQRRVVSSEVRLKFFTNFAVKASPGRFAEWLGAGLQNQLQRFESATDLIQSPFAQRLGIFSCPAKQACLSESGCEKNHSAGGSKRGLDVSFPPLDHEEGQRPDE